jgi:hypothetical protein
MKFSQFKNALKTSVVLLSLSLTVACAGVDFGEFASNAQNQNHAQDFGDAPDGLSSGYDVNITAGFPSRLSSNGAHHEDSSRVALGMLSEDGVWPATVETDATDTADADGVQNIDEEPGEANNDERDNGLFTLVFGDDEEATLEYAVTAAADATPGTYYVNVLFDWNKDGVWDGQDANGAQEWAVKNDEVTIMPGKTLNQRSPIFTTGVDAQPVWVRVTLSDTPVDAAAFPDGWDGTGAFAQGETEDYFLKNHQVIELNRDGKGVIGVPFNPFNPRPVPPLPPIGAGGGGSTDTDPCEYNFFMNQTICIDRSVTKLVTIDGFAPDTISAFSTNPGVASVSLNESNVTITGVSEGSATINVIATQGGCTYYLTVSVTVKPCVVAKKVRIDCCTPEEIRRDAGQCTNCHVVGRQHNQSNTLGGGGGVPEVDMEGEKTNVSKSFVVTRGGGLVDVITLYYDCDPCPEEPIEDESYTDPVEEEVNAWLDEIAESFFGAYDQEQFGGSDGQIDTWEEYEDLVAHYDEDVDDATYECASRYFEALFGEAY